MAEIAQLREAVVDVVEGPAPPGADEDAQALLDAYLPPLEELDRERGCAR
jgi:hypothetical protein